MADRPDLAADLLRGGEEIALAIYGSDDKATVRRLYNEQDRWPVFQLSKNGVLYALRSKIQAHLETKSAEKEARILAAAKAALAPKAVKAKSPRRRRARSATNKAA
jgi:hypothetical protein